MWKNDWAGGNVFLCTSTKYDTIVKVINEIPSGSNTSNFTADALIIETIISLYIKDLYLK